MESQGVQLVERDMGVDLQFTSTAGTVFWDDSILSRLHLADRQSSQQSLDVIVSRYYRPCVYCYTRQITGLLLVCWQKLSMIYTSSYMVSLHAATCLASAGCLEIHACHCGSDGTSKHFETADCHDRACFSSRTRGWSGAGDAAIGQCQFLSAILGRGATRKYTLHVVVCTQLRLCTLHSLC